MSDEEFAKVKGQLDYEQIVEILSDLELPDTYFPALVLEVAKQAISRKVFQPAGLVHLAARVEIEHTKVETVKRLAKELRHEPAKPPARRFPKGGPV